MDSPDFPLISWQVHPARERWKTALTLTAFIAITAWLTMRIMEQPGWGVFAFAVLVVACNRFYFPTRYDLTESGITARFPLRTITYLWADIRRFVHDETGGFLSPRVKPSFLDEYRGISLLFLDDAAKIVQTIRGKLPPGAIVREVMRKSVLREEGEAPCIG